MSSEVKNPQVEALQGQLKEAHAEIDTLSQKAAAYIEATQPELDKHAAAHARFEKRATEVAGVLVDRGIIPPAESANLVTKLASDHKLALDLVVRLARMVGPDSLGKAAADVHAPNPGWDAFERLAMTGDPNTNMESPLNVD